MAQTTIRPYRFISTHAPRAGRDNSAYMSLMISNDFNSRAPRGARRSSERENTAPQRFQLTRPARGATGEWSENANGSYISTHAPRAGRDEDDLPLRHMRGHFNSRAPRGARRSERQPRGCRNGFQLTRPARGATLWRGLLKTIPPNFNSRAPRGARLPAADVSSLTGDFNSRAPRGARQLNSAPKVTNCEFQLTRPARGATSR